MVDIFKEAPDYAFCLKLCPRGSLQDVIHVEGVRLTWPTVRSVGLQICEGLEYLHSQSVLHRDLKSSNILVYDDWNVFISDFDTAEFESVSQQQELESGKTRKNRTVGTLVTMAPEILTNTGVGTGKGFVFTKGADVYSLGVTLNEISTGTMPYSDRFTNSVNMHTVLDMNYSKHTLAAAIIRENLRPVLATQCPDGFGAMIQVCFLPVPPANPTNTALLER